VKDQTKTIDVPRGASAEDILRWAADRFGSRLALATSFGAEDQVLIDMLTRIAPGARIFTLDTGRLFPQTRETMRRTMDRYRVEIEVFAPDAAEVSELAREKGPDLFYASREDRLACCSVRKAHPLKKALSGLNAWICGLRREQSVTRSDVRPAVRDEVNGLIKIAPLHDWTAARVWEYLRRNNVPYNPLHDEGFPSIGCQPCTRAVEPGADSRSGRWWWEAAERRECGLHQRKQ
jgi:phosphoadenosine phosphosulfate reductase